MGKKTLWVTCAGIGVILLFALWMRMFYVSNYTISGISQKNGFAESDIKLSMETDYGIYYLYEQRGEGVIGILSVKKSGIGYRELNHFASSWSEDGYGTVQSFGRSVVHGTIVNYEVWGGVVPGSHETKIAVDDKIVEPQALKKLDGRIYFLYSEGDRQL